jgi:hypothetical protein
VKLSGDGRLTNRQTAQKLGSVGHCPKINAIFNVDVGTRDRRNANYSPKVGMRLAKFDFLRSLSLEQTPRAGENSGLDQASGSVKMIGEHDRRCSSRCRWAAPATCKRTL